MVNADELRAKFPRLYVFDRKTTVLRVDCEGGERLFVELDEDGTPKSPIPSSIVSFRWQYNVCSKNLAGDEMWSITQRPIRRKYPVYVGTLHPLNVVIGSVPAEAARNYLIAYNCTHCIVAPNGHVTPYDTGDMVVDPSEFGLHCWVPMEAA